MDIFARISAFVTIKRTIDIFGSTKPHLFWGLVILIALTYFKCVEQKNLYLRDD